MVDFMYTPLKKGEFRVLKFRSMDEESPLDIAVDLVHCTMKESEQATEHGGYVAISYTWDTSIADSESAKTSISSSKLFTIWSPSLWSAWTCSQRTKQPRVIIGNEKATRPITPTLYALLTSLKGKIYQPFWIDQLCINQDDAIERQIQVENMGQIYKGAHKVVVWLGPEETPSVETEGSNAAIDSLHQLCHEREVYGLPENNESAAKYHEVLGALKTTTDLPDDLTPISKATFLKTMKARLLSFPIDAVTRFLQRRWFTRFWTIQEVCLAKEVIFLCGSKEITWDMLRDAAGILVLFHLVFGSNAGGIHNHFDDNTRSRILTKLGLVNVKRMAHLVRTRRSLVDYGEKHTLLSLVKRFNVNTDVLSLGASDKRDRIFGLLGMSIDDLKMEGKYQRQAEDIFADFAAKEIQAGNIDLLALSSSPKSWPVRLFPSLPSSLERTLRGIFRRSLPYNMLCKFPTWVPDWDPPLSGSLRKPYGFNDNLDPLFSAGLALDSKVSVCNNVLTIQGKVVDVVDETSNVFIQLDPNVKDSVDTHCCVYYLRDIERLCGKAATRQLTYSDSWLQDARWRVAVGGVAYHLDKTRYQGDEQSFHYREELGFVLRLFRHMRFFSSTWANFVCFQKAYNGNDRGLLSALRFVARSCSWWMSTMIVGLAHKLKLRLFVEEPLVPLGVMPPKTGEFCRALFEMRDRRAFLSRCGYIGLGPLSLRRGDLIVVFGGASVPFALRRAWNGKYRLLGEVYCDGCMGPKAPEGELKDFELI